MNQRMKIRAESNEIEDKRLLQAINKANSWYSEKAKKICKSFVRMIKNKRWKAQKATSGMKKGTIIINASENKVIKGYY